VKAWFVQPVSSKNSTFLAELQKKNDKIEISDADFEKQFGDYFEDTKSIAVIK